MNELEKQIEEASKVDNRFDDRYKSVFKSLMKISEVPTLGGFGIGFKNGVNFILEKNLPVLFAEWLLNENDLVMIGSKSAIDHYDYWLNNVYGK